MEEIDKIIKRGKDFVFSPVQIQNVNDLILFEDEYCKLASELVIPFGDEWYDFKESALSLLGKRPFSNIAKMGRDETYNNLRSFNLDDLEIYIIRSYLQQVSEMYRPDAYYFGIPPFAKEIIHRLQVALSKLPSFGDAILVRQLNEHDIVDVFTNDILSPNYSLTTSANKDWNDGKGNQYVIQSLSNECTKARSIVFANSYEQQVTFLIGAKFYVDEIHEQSKENRIIYMHEIL